MKSQCVQNVKVFAPGRINLIGEHIDYNDGVVLPAAISLGISIEGYSVEGNIITIDNRDLAEVTHFDLTNLTTEKSWHKYVVGVLEVLKKRNIQVSGMNLTISSTLPLGAGMSSSSAFILAFTKTVLELTQSEMAAIELIGIVKEVEYNYIGVSGGIMDQFSIVFGKDRSFIAIDCQDHTYEYVEADLEDHSLMVIISGVEHKLSDSGYNQRRKECDQAKELLEISSFRELRISDLEIIKSKLSDETLQKRVKHVITEQNRVYLAQDLLKRKNFAELSDVILKSHLSLRDDYEVSCKEIDFIVNHLKDEFQVGSRIMGGGFGGSVIALIPTLKKELIAASMEAAYKQKFDLNCQCIITIPSQGLHKVH